MGWPAHGLHVCYRLPEQPHVCNRAACAGVGTTHHECGWGWVGLGGRGMQTQVCRCLHTTEDVSAQVCAHVGANQALHACCQWLSCMGTASL